jgi:hypothetical protein
MMKIIGSLFSLSDMPNPKPRHTDNEAIALMHRYLTDMLRSTADHSEKHNLSSDEIIKLLRELADESEAQQVVVNLRDNM